LKKYPLDITAVVTVADDGGSSGELRKNIQQSQGKAIINTDFMRNLTNSLQRAQRANKKALMERERSDERQELEEKGHSI